MDDLNVFVPDVTFEKIPIRNLVSNQDYQRNLSEVHIQRAAANFNIYQINPVKVSRRDGINYVFNGQHTIEIVALVSGSRDTPVWCMVYNDLSYSHEADIFANQQKFVKRLQPYEVFIANVEAENDVQLMIRDLVYSYNLKIGYKKAPSTICAVSTMEDIYQEYGYHVLDRVIKLCIGAWEGDMNSFAANIMKAIAKLIVAYGDALDDQEFKERLGALSVKQLSRSAKDRRPGSMGFAEVMVLQYNGKKKGNARLDLNKLYIRKSAIFNGLDEIDEDEPVETASTTMPQQQEMYEFPMSY